MKPPHCKICDHDHWGSCTECPECNKPRKRSVSEITRELTRGARSADSNPRGSQQDLSDRLEVVEKRLDAIDKRRKYQREYMRKVRKK